MRALKKSVQKKKPKNKQRKTNNLHEYEKGAHYDFWLTMTP